ncbi:MAG: type V CRISPR-associated protein Cas12a/Cpf1, partial [Sediminibacterium sp.]|nr:type V CRISPR-associated protein Cas12a/Cpf1 [Sediminibacterium sp.]
GFMRGRQKVDKQIYQKFEKMLIDKLNYYVDKDKFNSGLGGLLKALQLSSKFESFEKLGKQSGFLFYVPAFLTSKIDPTSGFVNLLYPKYETIKQAQEFLNKFESIQYNSQENHFEFSITNLNSFNPKAAGTQQNWTICTNGIRLENFRNKEKNYQWDTKDVKLTNEFKKLLDENNIHYVGGNCIKYEIVQINEAKFFKDLFHLLKLTLQIRNNRTGTDEDFLLSCVKNKDGYFYDSRDKRINQTLPENADANGAYNIARKGLMLIKRVQGELQKYDDKEKVDEKNKLVISNKEWLQFAQENN